MKKATVALRDSYGEAIIKSAKLLDTTVPGWYKKINLKKLDMPNTSLCMLGQLFGHDVEMSIAKELFPKEHAKINKELVGGFKHTDKMPGFNIGLSWFIRWANKVKGTAKVKRLEEVNFLHRACGGAAIECLWAEQVAERLAKDEK